MKLSIKTAHGYLSLQPDGTWEFRTVVGPYETFDLNVISGSLPVNPPPQVIGDQIDITNFTEVGAPHIGVAQWPATAKIQQLSLLNQSQGLDIIHSMEATWPEVIPPGWEGGIQYTLWMVRPSTSEMAGILEFWRTCHFQQGGNPMAPTQVSRNWLYWTELRGMFNWQPITGEEVGFFVTSGDQRRMNIPTVNQRSNTVKILWPAQSGQTFNW